MNGQLPRLAAVPAARSKAAVLKVRFYLILGALAMASLSGIFAAVSWLAYDPPKVDVTAADPRGKALAEIAAASFLAGKEITVPTAENVPVSAGTPTVVNGPVVWDGFGSFPLAGTLMESHRFLFNREIPGANGAVAYQLMRLNVLVAIPADANPVLAARPHYAPAEYRPSKVVTDYTDIESVTLPSGAKDQIASWATAWATDDAEKLKLLTGDQTASVRYVGLGGFSRAEAKVISAIVAGNDAFLVRARVVLFGANESTLEMDMDITITAASTGLPLVTGWGPAGSGVLTPADVRVGQ